MTRWQVPEAREPFAELALQVDPIAWLEARALEYARDLPDRRTFRFEHAGQGWFAKVHDGVGAGELLKNALVLRLPVFDAGVERRALAALAAAGVPTLEAVCWGWCGRNPLARRSFLVTREVEHVETLEDFWRGRHGGPGARRRVLADVAGLVRRMHDAGINHRDLYLVHFLLRANGTLCLVDLHRAQVRRRVPRRWRGKDLAALAFSARAAGGSGLREELRFLRAYGPDTLRRTLETEQGLLRDVRRRLRRLQRRGARG
ncbi:MAG: lipopolysaccharide core heptose(I) kinase RfaP [Pseudomonadales bacterium]|jgi:heptose I phosphotransferase|nr:lipopolysaccharide core heptose(I) kinase RfaP [Pseudomonadales bacterium]